MAVSATLFFSSSDTISKYLSSGLPIAEFMWIRYVILLVFALVLAGRRPGLAIRARSPGLQIVRALTGVASGLLFVHGVRQMTMAQATTISFLSPLLVTILSIPLLGETVGARRWAAVAAGLLGMIVVVRPGLDDFQPATVFGASSALCWALALVITRKLSLTDTSRTTLLWSAGIGTLILTAILPFQAVWPSFGQLGLSLLMGVLAAGGQWLVILAHRVAPASLLAPFFYGQLIWSAALGLAVFGNLPDRWTLAGAAIIVASGLYTAHRERVRRNTGAIARPAN